MSLDIEVLEISDFNFYQLASEQINPFETITLNALFSKERRSCCSHVAVAKQNEGLVGISTLSKDGGLNSNQPAITGFWVVPAMRRAGIGLQLLNASVDWILERWIKDTQKIRINAISPEMGALVESLDEQRRELVDLRKLY